MQPLIDPDNVDARRIKTGLPLISQYLKESFKPKWDAAEHKKNLPEIEVLMKSNASAPTNKF